ncbi:hypothetical protein LOZ53_004550 [Ophidiomyces ophidiicola]|nr:hypothetical protein LOZ53_004550 [Ophidiomyces ophidiicola]
MARKPDISSYFSAVKGVETPAKDDPSQSAPSSPLSSCPSNLSSQDFLSPKTTRTSKRPPSSLKFNFQSRLLPLDDESINQDSKPNISSQHMSSFGTSLGSSQRVVKDGQVIVTGSDGEDTDSVCSVGSLDDMLDNFLRRDPPTLPPQTNNTRKRKLLTSPKYHFSLESLVADTLNDRKTEAKISELKMKLQSPVGNRDRSNPNRTPKQRSRMFREDILASAIGEESNTDTLQKLKNAVYRTEAFDQEKSWSFFSEKISPTTPPRFPEKSVSPGSWEAALKVPISRDRAMLSGLVGESLSNSVLPDEVLLWILQSCTSEPRDDIRFSFCSALKIAPANRIAQLFHPASIDRIFGDLGARQEALATEDIVVPTFLRSKCLSAGECKYILSVLDLISCLSPKLDSEARNHTLRVLLRLTLDESFMLDSLSSIATHRAITSLFGDTDIFVTDIDLYELSLHLFKTIRDVALQSQVLKHIRHPAPQIAVFRCRLAAAFFFDDETLLTKPMELVFDLTRMTSQLRDNRFKTNRPSSTGWQPFDYWELTSLISILDVAIDSGTGERTFPDKQSEAEFNRKVDKLAGQIKIIFSAIQDTGASHLKRSEAKEFLQALYYRLIYAVRTKPQPKVSWFLSPKGKNEIWSGIHKSENLMEKFLNQGRNNGSNKEGLK